MARKAGSHSEITGPRVQAAAVELIARHGYAAVSMRQIAAQVGVQVGALYNYTPDKQGLLLDIMNRHLNELFEAWQTEPKPDDSVGQLEAFSRFHVRFHVARPDTMFIAQMELRNLTPENFEAVEGLRRRYEGALEAILQEGQEHGLFRITDVRLATMAVLALLTGVANWYREGGRLPLEEVERIHWEMVRSAVGAVAS